MADHVFARHRRGSRAISRLLRFARSNFTRFIRFGLVGVVGLGFNQTVLYLLHVQGGVMLALSSALATETAIIWCYFGHEWFTFQGRSFSPTRLLRYNMTSLVGLVITVSVLVTLDHLTTLHVLLANLIAIASATAWNFSISVLWTFKPPLVKG